MPNQPLITATVNITVRDINNNLVAKQFNAVRNINFDYNTGKVNIVDVTGSFYFSIQTLTTLTYVIVAGINGQHTVVAS